MTRQMEWVWLTTRKGIGGVKIARLMEKFKTPGEIFCADRQQLCDIEGIDQADIDALCVKDIESTEKIISKCRRSGYRILTVDDADYPERIYNIYSPPYVIYINGTLPDIDNEVCISIVGSRSATQYGATVAQRLAFDLASRGAIVVSGMARGIDGMAHRGALKAGGRTIAVLGCGLDIAYPKEHAEMMQYIAANGAVVSEYPPGVQPAASNFPMRNRIISGLSLGTVVIEAHQKSGSLITASTALEQGRDVFSVPANITDEQSVGSNDLIKQGAKLITCADDILNEYENLFPKAIRPVAVIRKMRSPSKLMVAQQGSAYEKTPKTMAPEKEKKPFIMPEGLSGIEQGIMNLLIKESLYIDDIASRLGVKHGEVSSALVMLELEGHIIQLPGKKFKINSEV